MPIPQHHKTVSYLATNHGLSMPEIHAMCATIVDLQEEIASLRSRIADRNMLIVESLPGEILAPQEPDTFLACADCGQPITGQPHLAGDLGHDDDYSPVPVVAICEDCYRERGA